MNIKELCGCVGITNTLGRILCGWLTDLPSVSPLVVTVLAAFLGESLSARSFLDELSNCKRFLRCAFSVQDLRLIFMVCNRFNICVLKVQRALLGTLTECKSFSRCFYLVLRKSKMYFKSKIFPICV